MQVTETQIDDLTRQFRVAVPLADIERKIESKLSEMAQSARLPGFRPGKVPVSLLRKRYGPSVKSEVVEEAINETSQAVISERGIRIALPPRVEVDALPAQGDPQGDLQYTMAVEVLPEITPPDYAQIRVERVVPEPDEAELERRLERFAEAMGEETVVEEDRPAAAGDIVVFDILSPEDRYPFQAEDGRGVRVRIGGEGPLGEFGAQLEGLAKGVRAQASLTLPAEARADLAGRQRTFDIEIKELRVRRPAMLDDGLAQRGGWENLEDLRGWLRRNHETDLKSLARMKVKRALLDRLAELYTFAVPKGLVDREYQTIVRQFAADEAGETGGDSAPDPDRAAAHDHHHDHDQSHDHVRDRSRGHDHSGGHDHPDGHEHVHGSAASTGGGEVGAPAAVDTALPEEKQQEYRSLAERRVRLGLVLAEIGRLNNLGVSQEELGKAMIAQARRYPGQERQVLDFLRKSPDAQEAVAAPILEDKVVDFILELAQVTERRVSAEELLREAEDEPTSGSESSEG